MSEDAPQFRFCILGFVFFCHHNVGGFPAFKLASLAHCIMIDVTAKVIIVNSVQSLRYSLMLLFVCVVTANKYKGARSQFSHD